MEGISGDREDYGIDDEKFEFIVQDLITKCLTSDTMLNVVIDSEVEKRLGSEAWTQDGATLAGIRADIISRGLEGVLETIAALSANGYDVDAADRAIAAQKSFDFDNLVIPDDLSGFDDLD